MTIEELRAHLVELDERKAEAESELEALRDSRRRLDELRAYPSLVNEYLKELPYLVHGTEGGIRDHAYTEEHEERMRQAPRGGPPSRIYGFARDIPCSHDGGDGGASVCRGSRSRRTL